MTRTEVRASVCRHYLVDYTSPIFVLRRVTYDQNEPLCPDCARRIANATTQQALLEQALGSLNLEVRPHAQQPASPSQQEQQQQQHAGAQSVFNSPSASGNGPQPHRQVQPHNGPAPIPAAQANQQSSQAERDVTHMLASMNLNAPSLPIARPPHHVPIEQQQLQSMWRRYITLQQAETGMSYESTEQEVVSMLTRVLNRYASRAGGQHY